MFSMSKSYGMAGWRVGFVVGNAEIVERINLLNDHCGVGIFGPFGRGLRPMRRAPRARFSLRGESPS
jgi:aspartate/methionine/tyrosine aminotransferase